MVYVSDPARKAELVPKLKTLYAALKGLRKSTASKNMRVLGLPTPAESDQAPDLVLAAKPDYAFSGDSAKAYITDAQAGLMGF